MSTMFASFMPANQEVEPGVLPLPTPIMMYAFYMFGPKNGIYLLISKGGADAGVSVKDDNQ